MKSFLNRRRIVFAAVLLIGLIGMTLILNDRNNHDRIIFTVDGDPVTFDEFKMQLNLERANVTSYFQNKYKAQVSKEFWNTPYGDEIPAEKLKKTVVDKLARTKAIKALALDYGLISDTSYEKFLADRKKENERRAKAIKENQPVYGPKQYGMEAYYAYYLSILELAIKNTMKAGPDQKQEKYEQLVDEKVRNAKIVINEKEFSHFVIN